MQVCPPKYALNFLRWFCREDYLEEIEGDLVEVFEMQYETSPKKAKWKFTKGVIRYFRPEFIKSFKSSYHPTLFAMFRHNFLLAFRNFKRYKTSFLINILGLSSGIACVLLIYLWVADELSVDKFHENEQQLFQILEHRKQAGNLILFKSTSGITASSLLEDMPEVVSAVGLRRMGNSTLSIGDKNIRARGQYTGKDYFTIFSFNMLQGEASQVLVDKNSIVISESLAINLFGSTENVVGKLVEWEHEKQFQVSGVFRDVPKNSSLQFDFVLSYELFLENSRWANHWNSTGPKTFILLEEGTDIAQFNEKIANYVQQKTNNKITHRTMFATKFSDIYLKGKYENGQQAGGRIEYVRLFSLVAIFILFIACINFMNLSTARASRRMKEVGIKKAVGAHRFSLIMQYLTESTITVLISFFIALALVLIFLPQFNTLTGKQLALQLDLPLLLTVISIAVLTGLLAGSYPALYLSKFRPSAILKGNLGNSLRELLIRKGLVILQFSLSIILIVSVIVVYEQIAFVQDKNLGYNKDNIIYFRRLSGDENNLKAFLAEAKNVPGIVSISSTNHDMTGHNSGTYGVQWEGRDPNDKTEFENVVVNYDAIELLDIAIKEGRTFSEKYSGDTAKIIFNESAIKYMGMTDPIGKVIKLWGDDREIIGVVKDFHFESLREDIKPLFFRFAPQSTWNIIAKIEAGKEKEMIQQLELLVEKFYPGFPFEYQFLDQAYKAQYLAEQRVSTLSKYFAGVAIIISCLGLFGLAAFTAERRIKEIGVRKVLGASAISIVGLLSNDFTKMVLFAITIALPLSYFIAQQWLESFAYQIDLEWWYFALAGILSLLIAWFTVGLQTLKAATINPVKCLKNE
ncbi:MAG: ABC transporter permease [Bacteroidota bacterium]